MATLDSKGLVTNGVAPATGANVLSANGGMVSPIKLPAGMSPMTLPANTKDSGLFSGPGAVTANKIPVTPASTTTVSNANKVAAAPAIQTKAKTLGDKVGLTTDPNGVPHNADGTIYTPPVDNSALIKSIQDQLTQAQAALKNAQSQGATAETQIDKNGNVINAPAPAPQTTYTNYMGETVPATATVPAGSTPDGKGGYTTPQGTSVNADDGSYETKQISDNITQTKAQVDANTASMLSSIQQTYQGYIQTQNSINSQATRALTNSLIMSGVAQGAPGIAAGEIQSVMSYGLNQISDLQAKENSALATAQKAGEDEDLQLVDKMNTLISDIRDKKIAAAQKIQDAVTTAKTQAQTDTAISAIISPTDGSTPMTDPTKILQKLQANGNTTVTLADINNTLKAITANGIDTTKLPADVQTFNWLKTQPNGLPASILALPDTASQLAAYLKMINMSAASVINTTIKTSGSGGAGTGAINVAQTAGITDTTVPLQTAIDNVGMDSIVQGIINNEGGSIAGVINNPGNIKIPPSGLLPGQSHSGVKASDGGEFANYDTVDDGKKAIADQIQRYADSGRTFEDAINTYTNTAPAVLTQADYNAASQVLAGNETMAQVPAANRANVNTILANAGQQQYAPMAASRFTTAASKIAANFIQLPQYQLTANGLPYLQRIDAAMKNPGSVSDQDLLDSLTKLNTAGNAISDAQIKLITGGQSFADTASVWANKFANGGTLSNSQRDQIQSIAKAIYANYQKGYQPVYDQVTQQLTAAGIPKAFWTMPDLNNLSAQATGTGGSGVGSKVQQSLTAGASVTDILSRASASDPQVKAFIDQARSQNMSDEDIVNYLATK